MRSEESLSGERNKKKLGGERREPFAVGMEQEIDSQAKERVQALQEMKVKKGQKSIHYCTKQQHLEVWYDYYYVHNNTSTTCVLLLLFYNYSICY